jgi:hypothetical protein
MFAVATGLVVVVLGVGCDGGGRAVALVIVVVLVAAGGEDLFGPTFRAAAGVFIELVTGTAFPLVPPPPTPEGAIDPLIALPYPLM